MIRPGFRPLFINDAPPSLNLGTLSGALTAAIVVATVIPELRLLQQHFFPIEVAAPTVHGCPAPEGEQTLVITVVRHEDSSLVQACALAEARGARRRAAP